MASCTIKYKGKEFKTEEQFFRYAEENNIEEVLAALRTGAVPPDTVIIDEKPHELSEKNRSLLQQLEETSRTVINKPIEGGDNAYFIGNKKVERRVTSFVKTIVKNKNWKTRVITEEQKNFEEQTKDWGSKGHADMQYLFSKYIREDGTIQRDQEGLPVVQKNEFYTSQIDPENRGIFSKLEDYVQRLLSSYPTGTVFKVEQTLYSKKRDMAGTMDFVAVLPDGKKDILDWKFTRLKKERKEKGEDIPWFKQEEWNLQMSEYKRILKSDYGQSDKDFRKTRMIPIVLEYSGKKAGDKVEYFPSSAEMSDVSIKFGEKSYLLPVATQDETTGNKKLDTLIQSLRTLYSTISELPASDKRKDLKNEQLNTLFQAIRHLQIEQNFSPLIEQIKVLIEETERIVEKYNTEFKDKDISSLSEVEISDQASVLLLKAQALHLYQNLDVQFEDIYGDKPTEEQKAILESLSEITRDARKAYHKIESIAGNFTDDYITSRRGVRDILDPEKTVTGITKTFGTTSELPTGALQTLYLIIDKENNRTHFEMREAMDELVPLEKEMSEWSKGKEKLAFTKLIKQKTNKGYSNELIDEYQQDFYDQLKQAVERKDLEWIQNNIDTAEFKSGLDRQKEEQLEIIEETIYSADPVEQNKRVKEAKEDLLKRTDYSQIDAWLNYHNVKKYPLSKWHSAEFKELNKKENAPVLNFYNYIKKWNRKAFEIGYLERDQQRKFLPYINKSFSERITLGGNFSFPDWLISTVSINEHTEGYGNFNPLTGQIENSVPRYFTSEIDTPEQISEDLFKNMALYTRAVINYKNKISVDGQLKMLYFIEQNKHSLQTDKFGNLVRELGQTVEVDSNQKNADLLMNHIKALQYGQKYTDTEGTDTLLGGWAGKYNSFADKVNDKLGFSIIPKTSKNLENQQVSATRLIDITNNAFTLTKMGMNVAVSASVFAGGNFQALINSGTWYTGKEFLSSEFQHAGHKVFKNNYKLHMAMIKTFMPIDEELQREINRLSLSKVNSSSFSEFMMVLMRKADHLIQYSNFLSFMKNTIIIDGELKNARQYYRDSPQYRKRYSPGFPEAERRKMEREFENRVKELIKEHGIEEKARVDENGNLVIDGIENIKSDTVFKYRTLINSVGRRATGNISPDNEMLARMNAIYRSMLVFKNWIPGMVKQRAGGLRFDTSTQEWTYGRVRMIVKHLGPLALTRIGDITNIIKGTDRGIELLRKFYEKQRESYELKTGRSLESLTEEEFMDMFRQALKSQIKELIILLSLLLIVWGAGKLKPDDDDDDEIKNRWKFTYRMLDKVRDEVWFYYNPVGLQQILNGSIFPSLGVFSDAARVVGSATGEFTGIITGDEDRIKSNYPLKNFLKSLPLTKEAIYYIAMFDADLAKEMGIQLSVESRLK